jgi:hypothetical protein
MASSLRAKRSGPLYVPEENPEAMAAQEYAQSKYNELMDPYRKFKQGIIQDAYNNVLQQTGDPRQAELAANSIAGKISRTEFVGSIVAPEAALAGAGRSIGAARDLASRVMGGSRAAEAPGAMRALPAPRRNAMYPDEMLAPEVIPMGGPSPNAPRLTYAKPETRYQMAVDRQAQGRSPTNYDRPEINEMFVRPEDARSFSSGSVRGAVDPLDALAAEGGPSSDAVELAQRIARQRAEGRAATVANEEARFAGGEGPNYAGEVLNQRRLAAEQRARAAEQEARFQSGQVDAMANEGGGAGRQATINDLNRAVEADFRARQMGTLDDEAGAITSGRNPPQRVARALQVVEREPMAAAAPAPGPGTGFTMIDTPGQGFTMTPPSRAMTMRTVGSEAAPVSASSSMPASAYYSDPALAGSSGGNGFMRFAPVLVAPASAAAALYGTTKLIDQINGPKQTAGQPQPTPPAGAGTNISDFSRLDYVPPSGTDIARFSQMDFMPPATKNAVQQARTQAAPMPPTRPAELAREQPGILSKIFGQPATTRQLFEQSQADPSDSGAWMRAERQYARTHKDDPNFDVTKFNEQGMKRGGAAGKPDSVHKALEIIHHLLTRSH